jgi:hypothetical protein
MQEEALRNMLVFPLSDISSQSIDVHEVTRFLTSVYREFLNKSVQAGFVGWFYAWLDEMSGTLRCGACRAIAPVNLPFSCRLEVVHTPEPISRQVADSKYRSDIPADEFEEIDFTDDEEEKEFILTLFVRPLMRSV